MGDFNCVLKGEEGSSESGVSECFANWVSQRGLIDLGFIGQSFTWNHGGSLSTRHSARLDRGMCDDQWRRIFPKAMVKHLSHSYSDHCPLLLTLDLGKEKRLGERPFRFQSMWLRHKDFMGWMKNEWKFKGNFTTTLREFRSKLESWNKDTFGNVFQRNKRNMLRLEGVQRVLERGASEAILRLENKLKLKRQELLIQEEILWLQNSRNE